MCIASYLLEPAGQAYPVEHLSVILPIVRVWLPICLSVCLYQSCVSGGRLIALTGPRLACYPLVLLGLCVVWRSMQTS